MPNVPALTGQIYLSSFYGKLSGQTVISTWTHVLEVTSGSPTVDQIYAGMNADFAGINTDGKMAQAYRTAAAANFTLEQYRVQCIYPIRYAAAAFNKGYAGTQATDALTTNNAVVIYRRGDLGSRKDQSSLHFPAAPTSQFTDGIVSPVYRAAEMESIRTKSLATVTLLGGTVNLKPCIFHRGPQPFYSLITFGVVQDTVRTMRRRTVGLGI